MLNLHLNKLRGGAVVARWAHNPKVGGSNPPSATKKKPFCESRRALLFSDRQKLAFVRDENNKDRRHASAWQGFFFVKHPQEEKAERTVSTVALAKVE
jgi:hypothetical protein